MKILAIRIKNLASLEGVTEIDFTQEPLSSAGIFAITGPTGAGKSTILDALCLGLFARTPRYRNAEGNIDIKDVQGNTIKQDDVRGILRDGTAEGYASVDFVAVDGQHYCATWSVRRARNKVDGSLQTADISLRNLSTNADVPGKKTELLPEIERLVGLNFEQFTRSVLLAQGDFTAFLKAGRDEKSSLLEKLTGTQIYTEISKLVFGRHKLEEQKLDILSVQRKGIQTLTAEEQEQLTEKKTELETSLQTQEKRVQELSGEITWYEQLAALQTNITNARFQQTEAQEAKEAAKPRIHQLAHVERVQTVRTVVENLHTAQQQHNEKETQLVKQQEVLTALQEKQEQYNQAFELAQKTHNEKFQQQQDAQPLLNEAKALDVQLDEKVKQGSQAKAEFQEAQNKQKQAGDALAAKEKEASRLATDITRLSVWKQENLALQVVAEQESLIISKLQDAAQWLKAEQTATTKLQNTNREITQLQTDKAKQEKQQLQIEPALQNARQELETLQAVLAKMPVQTLQQDKTRVDTLVQQLTEAAAHWQLLHTAEQEQERLVAKLGTQEKELQKQQEQLIKTEGELEKALLQKDASNQMLKSARLAATENITDLRSQLTPHEACPVCGSKEHPYVTENQQLDHVLAKLEATYLEQEQTYLRVHGEQSRLQEAATQLKVSIAAAEKELISKQQQVISLDTVWTAMTVYKDCRNIPVDHRTEWLRDRLNDQKNKQQQLQEMLDAVQQQQQAADAKRNERDVLEKDFIDINNKIKDTGRTLLSQEEAKQQQLGELQTATAKLEEIQTGLNSYFTSAQWFAGWKTDSATVIQTIQKNAAAWKSNVAALDKQQQEQEKLAATLTGMEQQHNLLAEVTAQKEHSMGEVTRQYRELNAARKQLFEGRLVADVEQMLKEAITWAQQHVEQCRNNKEQLQQSLTRTTTEITQTDKDRQQLQQQQGKLQTQLQEWLSDYNRTYTSAFSETDLKQLLAFTTQWIEDERKAILLLNEALTRAESIFKERETALTQHQQKRQPTQSAYELQHLLAEAKNVQEEENRALHEIEFKLKEDTDNRKKVGKLLAEIETQARQLENWAKLNEVIGSADGKKFRQIAQEYTLDLLLGFANVHLDVLSKRYKLQRIPASLGLQVIDQDMGDEVRTVYSLSGGESFLVSLALALGLASLSSSRMKVESLFIDEGFGSLDPQTLNIAMDALERLHHQGRKVGVISHVQEMTERIPVQIKVSKQQSGKSGVAIAGSHLDN